MKLEGSARKSQALFLAELNFMKSHLLFTAECQLRTIEERVKRTRAGQDDPECYWTIKDHRDVIYLVYHRQRRLAELLKTIIPEEEERLSPPVRLEGYLSVTSGNKYLCVLRCALWNSETEDYETIDPRSEEKEDF